MKKITSQIKEENQNPIIDLDAIMKEERKTNEDKAKIKNDKKDTGKVLFEELLKILKIEKLNIS